MLVSETSLRRSRARSVWREGTMTESADPETLLEAALAQASEIEVRAVRQTAARHHVTLLIGGQPLYDDALSLTSRKARAQFVDAAVAHCRSLWSSRDALTRELERLAVAESTAPREDTGPPAQGSALAFELVEPWDRPVDGGALLDEIRATLRRYVVMPAHADVAAALWVVHTYALPLIDYSPRLLFVSAEKRSGKSRALRVVGALALHPLAAENVTTAAMFRTVEAHKPTLLLDEADAWLVGDRADDALRGLVNAGCEPDGRVIRCVGDDAEPRTFGVYAAVAIAMIGRAPATIEDRSVMVTMRRALAGERVERLRMRDLRAEVRATAQRCVRWVADHRDALRAADPAMPASLDDRAADVWRPLMALADLAAREWPQLARAAADALTGGRDADDSSRGTMLLRDVRDVFAERGVARISSADLVVALCRLDERPWSEWRRGRPITPVQVARLLKPYGITPATMRLADESRLKGYDREAFADAWLRYLPAGPPSEPCHRDNAQSAGVAGEKRPVTASNVSRIEIPRQRPNLGDVTASRLNPPVPGENEEVATAGADL